MMKIRWNCENVVVELGEIGCRWEYQNLSVRRVAFLGGAGDGL